MARRFYARGAPKFQKFCNSSARFWRRFCVISTPSAHFFGFECFSDSLKRCSDVIRTLAECTQVLCARRGEILKFLHIFRAISNGSSRKICTLSNAGRALFRIQTHYRFIQKLQQRHAICSAHAGRKLEFFGRAARINSENFAFLSRELCRKMCVISVLHLRLSRI